MRKYRNYTQKCVIQVDYVQHSSLFTRVMCLEHLGTRPFALHTVIKTMVRGSFLETGISQGGEEGGRGLGEMSQVTKSLKTREKGP